MVDEHEWEKFVSPKVQLIPTRQHGSERRVRRPRFRQRHLCERSGNKTETDLLRDQLRDETRRGGARCFRHAMQASAANEIRPKLPDGSIESNTS